MKFVEEMSERMDEELEGAEDYAEEALANKSSNPMLSKHLHDMAGDEIRHASYFGAAAMEYVKMHPDKPEIKYVWDFVKRHTDKRIEKIEKMLEKYRS